MSISSCIRRPENNRYIQLHEWQLHFCQGSHCAALLLSVFISWHDWKLRHDVYYRKANDIAEAHGDDRPHNENAYLFFTTEELIEHTMNFYGKSAINDAIQLLKSLNVITVSNNPNPRYHFDKTKYFQFYPSVCNRWIDEQYSNKYDEEETQVSDFTDRPKVANRSAKNSQRLTEISQPSAKTSQAITNNTNNTTNKNQSIKTPDDFFEQSNNSNIQNDEDNTPVRSVIHALSQQGFSEKHFAYPDTAETIQRLCEKGATVTVFLEAYAVAKRVSSRGFGVNYLAKVVEDLLDRTKQKNPLMANREHSTEKIPEYENDYSGSKNWMEDLID